MLSSCTIHVISRLDQCQCWIPIWIDHFPTIFHENRLLKESVQGHCSSHGRYKDHHLATPSERPSSGPDKKNFPWLSECECQARKICSKQKSKTYTLQHRPDWIPAYPAGQRVFYFSVSLRAGHSTWTRTWGALGIAKSTKSRLS